MFAIRICLDNEMHMALMDDAGRHLRPTVDHAKALLRQALGLQFPYPEGFDERYPETFGSGDARREQSDKPLRLDKEAPEG